MSENRLLQILLIPFSLLYGLGIAFRNLMYRLGFLKEVSFDVPIISVGNLSVGGEGKTPHVEYLIRLLRPFLKVATLSRGYKRKTKGFRVVQPQQTAEYVGDEPIQFKRKYPDITVTVGESRALAIPKIMMTEPQTQVILLDDAFQHRAVKPGLNILLSTFSRPYFSDFILPTGRLREFAQGAKRADMVIITKCPPDISSEERAYFTKKIKPLPHQKIFFSTYEYGHPYYMFNFHYRLQDMAKLDVLLVCAIARSEYLVEYLESQAKNVRSMLFEDHHLFTKYDVSQMKTNFDRLGSDQKVIITTEKDATRLEGHRNFFLEQKLPLFVLPARVKFLDKDGDVFDESVKSFLLNFKV